LQELQEFLAKLAKEDAKLARKSIELRTDDGSLSSLATLAYLAKETIPDNPRASLYSRDLQRSSAQEESLAKYAKTAKEDKKAFVYP
jgi:hypothetical protein